LAVDIEKPRWRAGIAAEIAGITTDLIGQWRQRIGLRLGKFEVGGWRFSALDIAELTCIPALRALGLSVEESIAIARKELRVNLRDALVNRLFHGFWSLGGYQIAHETGLGTRTIYIDAIIERVIAKLALPLPAKPLPRTSQIAARMVDTVCDYCESPPGLLRWQRWRESVLARGVRISFGQAAAELGAPAWFLRAVIVATTNDRTAYSDRAIIEIVRPRAPKVAANLEGVTLQ
jgi:hypothetical protein